MSNVLYLGNTHTADWIRPMIEANGGYLYTAATMYQALAEVVMYSPDLVILDAGLMPEIVPEVAMHLETIDVEPVIVYDEDQLLLVIRQKMQSDVVQAA